MSEDLTKRFEGGSPFERRVIAEFASMRGEIGGIGGEIGGMRGDIAKIRIDVDVLRTEVSEIRVQQAAMARNIASLDQRVTSLDQRVTSMDQRLNSLEEKVDMRLKETQPIWEAVKAKIDKLDGKFTLFIRDLYEIRGDIVGHSKRLDTLEGKVLS